MLSDPIIHEARPKFVVTGDFNNDHQMDIAVSDSDTDEVVILLGCGNGTFAIQTAFKTGDGSNLYCIAVGNFNNDNTLDITVANYGTNSVGVYLGNGNGTFTLLTTLSLGPSRPVSIAIADFNNDNHLDIVVSAIATEGSQKITLSTGTNSNPQSIAIGDLNQDNRLDICVANSGSNNVAVFLGHGNGYFTPSIQFSTGDGSNPASVAIGDVNSDHQLDICVSNSGTSNIGVLLGLGNVNFASQTIYTTGVISNPYSLTVADFNNDNRSDITVSDYGTDTAVVLLDFDPTNFQHQTTYPTGIGSNPSSITVGDFNNDNQLDIAVANSDGDNIGVLLEYGNGSFSTQAIYSTGNTSGPCSISVGDFNSDGWLDIAVANFRANNIGVLLGYGNGTFASQETYSTGINSSPSSIAVGDFNNDIILDIAVANVLGNNVGVLVGYGNGTFGTQKTYSTGSNSFPLSVTVADFNNGSILDITVANLMGQNVGILLRYGNGTFATQVTYSSSFSIDPISITIGDCNNDSILDIVVADIIENCVCVLLGYGNGSFAIQATYSTGSVSHPYSAAVGYLNNNNLVDIAVANSQTNNVGILIEYEGLSWVQVSFPTGSNVGPMSVVVGDFNNDSLADIVVANYGTNNMGVFLGNDIETFGNQSSYFTGPQFSPISFAVCDVNIDSRLDIVVANSRSDCIGDFLDSEMELLKLS
ncbi:unnamed protein product [Rotaria socialis]|uniref:Uncharacterized protein n=1 Tax=Rotaria socialis TaxID=392032 RepID=A0A818MKJ2_9BILA|nr:unnamed protein product [Rotaria socialis]CAF3471667.1 unnamed protein product [Rotaria socialis]CAF3590765.1 unnamed protein product [Rotaria socialis]CAF3687509.1 unnamed protein product [Rotaria socialis]CAF4189982.1 unnamed protein product [Rotaria socialis]